MVCRDGSGYMVAGFGFYLEGQRSSLSATPDPPGKFGVWRVDPEPLIAQAAPNELARMPDWIRSKSP